MGRRPGLALAHWRRQPPPAVRRTKLTQQGYDVVQVFARKYGLGSAQSVMALIDNMEQEKPVTPFMPIPDAQKVEMESRYLEEMKGLKGR